MLAIVLCVTIYAEITVDGFADKLHVVMRPIANAAIAIGIFTFIVNAYQQSIQYARENVRALDKLNQYGWLDVEKIFLDHPELGPLYHELYVSDNEKKTMNPRRYNFYPNVNTSVATPERVLQNEYHVISYLIQVMENVYSVGDLESTYANAEMEGWMNTFRSWSRSSKFKEVWHHNKHLYGRSFREWVDVIIYNNIL